MIDQSQVQGEAGTGYEGPNGLGPFKCGNCEYFRPENSSCGQKTMVRLSKQPETADGRIKVHVDGCCEYVKRIGKQ